MPCSNDDFIMTTSVDWATAAHWSLNAAPTASEPAFIEAGGTCTLNGSGKVANSLTIGANDGSTSNYGNGTLSLTSGAVLTISNGLQFGPSSGTARNGTLAIAGGLLSLGGATSGYSALRLALLPARRPLTCPAARST